MVCSASVFGQTGTGQGSRARPDPVQRELQRRFESEAIEQALAERPRLRADHERRLVLTQIRDDFLQLQILNDQLQRAASQLSSPDWKTISKSAAAITTRAQRLKENLRLPKMEGVGDRVWGAGEDGKLSLSMSELSNAIKMFVENPVFEKLGQQASKTYQRKAQVSVASASCR